MLKRSIVAIVITLASGLSLAEGGKFLGNLSDNPYDPNSVNNPYGQYGSKYSPDSINNPYGKYGSKYSNDSARNPYATNAPRVIDQFGNDKGALTANPYAPDRYKR